VTILNDLSFSQFATRIAAYLILAACYGFALAALANWMGDRDPAFVGRRTLNPFAQLSLLGLAATLLVHIGWIRPLRVDAAKLKGGCGGAILLSLLSLAVLLGLISIINPLRQILAQELTGTLALYALGVVEEVQQQGAWFIPLHILPIPGLAGGLWLRSAFPRIHSSVVGYDVLSMPILCLLSATGVLSRLLEPGHALLSKYFITQIS
jgi:hypothetical protein